MSSLGDCCIHFIHCMCAVLVEWTTHNCNDLTLRLYFILCMYYQDGRTPFYIASQNGHLEVVKYLKEAGADMYAKSSVSMCVSQETSHMDSSRKVRDVMQTLQ